MIGVSPYIRFYVSQYIIFQNFPNLVSTFLFVLSDVCVDNYFIFVNVRVLSSKGFAYVTCTNPCAANQRKHHIEHRGECDGVIFVETFDQDQHYLENVLDPPDVPLGNFSSLSKVDIYFALLFLFQPKMNI